MALVKWPKRAPKGGFGEKDDACGQWRWPAKTGSTADRKASPAAPPASTTAKRVTRRSPSRLAKVNRQTIPAANTLTGTVGRYHWWSADADKRAVRPHVGTQPHQ